jgi:hypothetical protein
MSKTGKKSNFQGFREFYEDRSEDKLRSKKPKTDNGRAKTKLQNKLKRIDPKSMSEEDFDDFE